MFVRGMVMRLIELRARRFSDPAQRLQFLQRTITPTHTLQANHRRVVGRILMVAIPLGLVAVSTAWVRRALAVVPAAPLAVRRPRTTTVTVKPLTTEPATVRRVWLVDTNPKVDLYSNGLRVENEFVTSTQSRAYLAFVWERNRPGAKQWRHEPAGIVFHTTESHMAPFEENQNQTLKRTGESLLEFVRRRQSYHFVIDRFGRVFRVVKESDYANHSGNSVWADDSLVYVNLNQSFFGVAFEAQSRREVEGLPVNPAQVHAGRILTEMLRSRYGIAAANCVAHAQVSVNPKNMRAGYHSDWAENLPFRDLGLSDNYGRPLPSVTLFGFMVDGLLSEAGESPLGQGLQLAEDQVGKEATALGLPLARYRKTLQERYRETIAALHAKNVSGENN